jgi:hypothetical protein
MPLLPESYSLPFAVLRSVLSLYAMMVYSVAGGKREMDRTLTSINMQIEQRRVPSPLLGEAG